MMRNGTIQQSGTPQELYNTPKNEFVARFIGNSNLVPCGEGQCNGNQFYFFRPEHTTISTEAPSAGECISFRLALRSLEYVGPYYILEGVSGNSERAREGAQDYIVRAHASESELHGMNIRSFSPDDPPWLWFCIERGQTRVIPK
ncbi:MAG: hypothetical protein ACOC7X_10060 [Spirochaetota bacterium]